MNYFPTKISGCPIIVPSTAGVKVEHFGEGDYELLGIIAQACANCPFGPNGNTECRVGEAPTSHS